MDWKTVRQCEYRGYTITDTGAGFWIHCPTVQVWAKRGAWTMLWSESIGILRLDICP